MPRAKIIWTHDPDLRGLLRLCLLEGTFAHFARHWDRIGELAGDRLDELAAMADQNAPILHTHDRFGHIAEGQQAFAELLRIDPNFLIERHREVLPFRNPEKFEN